ncbi:MAG: magnesium chelatase [Chloroflexota bacterium]|nr:magnesium chelatase [Chloroflexota bacterium]MDE2941090.1 magnesium chelatase [Chloroflexota bacterium]MDE3267384.1 magnesium chelatase [Chloroflexota bacterium]
MTSTDRARTLGELKASGYRVVSVREEMRRNLIDKIRANEELFPGIVGYEDTVIPEVENAILAGQDIILLGERGQAKSRLIRALVELLDDEIPCVDGCEINCNPFDPICRSCDDRLSDMGDDLPVCWLGRDRRYAEKLATPDIAVADLIGEVDPIKVAEGRYLSDELTIHYGLIPRTNRGIFSINELPDLAERIQVGLFNLMEEKDVQIKGYRIRLPLDVYLVASANPEDYTNRGRIITPLKDRYGAQIRTHYPRRAEEEIRIMEQESSSFSDVEDRLLVPGYMKEITAEITSLARRSPEINQRSGVSVRVSIANYESLVSNAYRRSLRQQEEMVVPRISDLAAIIPSTMGKIELETMEDGREGRVLEDLTKRAVLNVFGRYLDADELEDIVLGFEEGLVVETGGDRPSSEYVTLLAEIEGFDEPLRRLGVDNRHALVASGMEFILEGLHLKRRLNKDRVGGRYRYRG